MNAPERFFLPDVQSTADHRRLAIQSVGVKGLRYPLVLNRHGEPVSTVATLTLMVGLPPDVKGTHMSRFVELLETPRRALSHEGLFQMLEEMLQRLDARSGRIELAFPYFIRKAAPVSGIEAYRLRRHAHRREAGRLIRATAARDGAGHQPCLLGTYPSTARTTSARTSPSRHGCARR
jgi:GTP cyclohydrolase I